MDKRTIPSLDGWRAVSILLVLGLHSLQAVNFHADFAFATRAAHVLMNGALGVRIFFVISGYLITRLLLREHAQTGSVALGRFYLRRAFRILPPFYVYLLFIALLVAFGRLAIPANYLALCGIFLTGYLQVPQGVPFWPLEHTWSLCVEEQFYLVWPALLVWSFAAKDAETRQGRAMRIALGGIVLIPLVRIWWSLPPFSAWHAAGNAALQLDIILFGVLGAVAEGHRLFERVIGFVSRFPWLLFLLLYIVSGWLEMSFPGKYIKSVGSTVNGALILCLMLWTIRQPGTWIGRLLNAKAVVRVGVLSYSLYLWQTFFLHRDHAVLLGLSRPLPLPMSWLIIALCGLGSFYLVERPALKVRDRLMRRTSPVQARKSIRMPELR